jgi:hypothetical protein
MGTFPDTFERRFVEALEFIHGASLTPTLIKNSSSEFHEIEVRNAPPPVMRSHALPPIETRDVSLKPAVAMLLEKYLSVLLAGPESVTSHPCSSYLALARSNNRDISTWAIGVSVAAEGIAKLLPAPPIETNGDLQELRTDILKFMQAGSYDEALQSRIAGIMKGLDSPGPKGRMYALVAAGEVLAEDIRAWSGLRNKAVHTPGGNMPAVSDTSFQQLIDAIHTVYRLSHMMTFSLIGYQGDFTDYAMRGFPTRQFPAPTAIPKDNSG